MYKSSDVLWLSAFDWNFKWFKWSEMIIDDNWKSQNVPVETHSIKLTVLSIPIFPQDTLKGFNQNLSFVRETRNLSKIRPSDLKKW